jgi:hypothetical protein
MGSYYSSNLLTEYVVGIRENNANIKIRKSEGERTLGKPRRRWKDLNYI